MSALVKVVDSQDVDVINKYFSPENKDKGIVLVFPHVAKTNNITDTIDPMYEFGGQPDIKLDIVRNPNHLWLAECDYRKNNNILENISR